MQDGELFQFCSSLIGQFDEGASAIVGVDASYEEVVVDRAADQLSGGMESPLERFGDVGSRCRRSGGFRPTDHQEQLVLGGCDAVITRRLLGEGHEPTHPSPEFGE